MKTHTLGASPLHASKIILGTWVTGGEEFGPTEESESIEAIQTSFDAGINCIDTAPIYGRGLAETIVGKAIRGRRDETIIATKVGLRWDLEEGEFNFEAGDGTKIYKNLKPASIRKEVENSLRRLGTDYIDLLQTHWPDATTPIAETMDCLLELKREGKVRAIGVCNTDPAQMDAYLAVGPLDSLQTIYSMVDRDAEADLLPRALENNMAVLAYSPLAMGLLSGKLGPERQFPPGDVRSWSPRFTVENRKKTARMLEQFTPLAEANGLSVAQLVIAWTLARCCLTHVLCGARNAQQAAENAASGQKELDPNTIAKIDNILAQSELSLPHPFK